MLCLLGLVALFAGEPWLRRWRTEWSAIERFRHQRRTQGSYDGRGYFRNRIPDGSVEWYGGSYTSLPIFVVDDVAGEPYCVTNHPYDVAYWCDRTGKNLSPRELAKYRELTGRDLGNAEATYDRLARRAGFGERDWAPLGLADPPAAR